MTSHELARLLFASEDKPVTVFGDDGVSVSLQQDHVDIANLDPQLNDAYTKIKEDRGMLH